MSTSSTRVNLIPPRVSREGSLCVGQDLGADAGTTAVSDYIRRFGAALNKAMGIALPSKHKKGQPTQYVAFIVPCKGIPFYGYHVGYVPYLKIYIVHPRHKTRLSEVLRSGAVLGTQFDVFEAHVPFLLQFMLDANLFGCGWVEVGTALFREDVPGECAETARRFATF